MVCLYGMLLQPLLLAWIAADMEICGFNNFSVYLN